MQARTKEQAASDLTRKLQRSLRETKEELAQLQAKEQEFAHKKKDLEKRYIGFSYIYNILFFIILVLTQFFVYKLLGWKLQNKRQCLQGPI